MLIRELEQRTGLDRATIRYYEKESLIVPERKENGYREYTQEDCENLLKIKLLRQLEIPLHKIKDLQEGSGNFHETMEAQLSFLEEKQQRTNLTKQVCNQIRNNEENYTSLDAGHYLSMLDESTEKKDAGSNFTEIIPQERHPWLRYLSRLLDISLVWAILFFIMVVTLRIRPIQIGLIISYISLFLCIPTNAFCLHKWGTTPGKYVFGIQVVSADGAKLSYKDALWRELNALRFGMGYNIPFYSLWCNYKSYKQYAREGKVDYDKDCEVLCEDFASKKKLPLAALLGIISTLILICAIDGVKPTHRGNLTVKEFSENYNDYASVYKGSGMEHIQNMDVDGSWRAIDIDKFQLPPNWPANREQHFKFHPELGTIQTITYENRWEDPFLFSPLDNERFLVAYTLVASQEGITYAELYEFENMYRQKMKEGTTEGSLVYKNVSISWKIDTEYTAFKTGIGVYQSRSNKEVSGKTSYVNLIFKIEILDN